MVPNVGTVQQAAKLWGESDEMVQEEMKKAA